MNKYPLWKYAIIVIAIVVSALYAAPNLFGEVPAVQVSAQRGSLKVDEALRTSLAEALKAAGVPATDSELQDTFLRFRFAVETLSFIYTVPGYAGDRKARAAGKGGGVGQARQRAWKQKVRAQQRTDHIRRLARPLSHERKAEETGGAFCSFYFFGPLPGFGPPGQAFATIGLEMFAHAPWRMQGRSSD